MDVTFRNAHKLVAEKVKKLKKGKRFSTREMTSWVGKSSGRVATALKRLEERNRLKKGWKRNVRVWTVKG